MRFYAALTAPRSLPNTFQKGASCVVATLIRIRVDRCIALNSAQGASKCRYVASGMTERITSKRLAISVRICFLTSASSRRRRSSGDVG